MPSRLPVCVPPDMLLLLALPRYGLGQQGTVTKAPLLVTAQCIMSETAGDSLAKVQ